MRNEDRAHWGASCFFRMHYLLADYVFGNTQWFTAELQADKTERSIRISFALTVWVEHRLAVLSLRQKLDDHWQTSDGQNFQLASTVFLPSVWKHADVEDFQETASLYYWRADSPGNTGSCALLFIPTRCHVRDNCDLWSGPGLSSLSE